MNKAITDGVVFMPPAFEDGLSNWSSEDGTPGSLTYSGASNAAVVPADQDFAGCLELFKDAATQKLRYMGQTPFLAGCYLRVSARVKAISGPLPSVRIAAWAAKSNDTHATGYAEVGQSVDLTSYGKVVEVSAIIGSGARSSVDMVWGDDVAYAHIGLDLTGTNGGTVRIDDIVIEDITGAYLRDMMDWVDVRDFGAVGDGVTDDRAAFLAADAAALGKTMLVPEGTYFIGSNLTINADVRFEGTMTMADSTYLSLTRSFDLPTYIDAFGDEMLGFKKAFQALLNYSDHQVLDMCGRRIEVTEPIDMQAAYAASDSFLVRRVISNGQFYAIDDPAWDDTVVNSTASYNKNNPDTLSGVTNVAAIQVGSIVTGNGVGREVYVKSVDIGASIVKLSQPLWGANASQSYTFTRHKYIMDLSGFSEMHLFSLTGVEFQCNGYCSAFMMPPGGENFTIQDCFFVRPKNHGISSIGRGCQGLMLDRNQFISHEQSLPATDRVSVAFNVNANDAKIRQNRFQRMGTSMVLHGSGHIIQGNHLFQGDEVPSGPRVAGMVLTQENVATVINGNYVDNCFIEWNNEHDASPNFSNEYSFGGLTITGNIFMSIGSAAWFSWIVLKPYGNGHTVSGLHVSNNTFRTVNGTVNRAEKLSTSYADLDFWSVRDVTFENNVYYGVSQATRSPVTLQFNQNSVASTWTCDGSDYLPFGGNARTVSSVVIEGDLKDSSNAQVWTTPHVKVNQGTNYKQIKLNWSKAVKGSVRVTMRVDNPA